MTVFLQQNAVDTTADPKYTLLEEYGVCLQKRGWFFASHHISDKYLFSEKLLSVFPDPWVWLAQLLQNCHDEICSTLEIDSSIFEDQIFELLIKKLEYLKPYRFLLQEIFMIPDFKGIYLLYNKSFEITFSSDLNNEKKRPFLEKTHTAFLFFIFVKGLFTEEPDLLPYIQNQIEMWAKIAEQL